MQIFWAIVFSFAAFGVWTAVSRVTDWINADDKVDVTRLDSGAEAATTTANNTREVTEILRHINDRVGAKRNTRPTTPSGKTARKRSTKAGK